MKVNLLCKMSLMVLLSLMIGTGAAWATTISIDWTGDGPGNLGSEFTPTQDDDLKITAKTKLGEDENALSGGTAGTVYWGNLGGLDTGMGSSWLGLGVQRSEPDAMNNWGSEGISGGGGDQDEALIFTFAKEVDASSVQLTLIGLNFGLDPQGNPSMNNDIISLSLQFWGENPLDEISIDFTQMPTYLLDFSTLGLGDGTFGSFAIRANNGHFGVGGISYTYTEVQPVPEPATISLLGIGLLGLGYLSRKRTGKK